MANCKWPKLRRSGIFFKFGGASVLASRLVGSLAPPKMPPRRGWGIFGLGFYKDVAPTALGNSHREIRKTRELEIRRVGSLAPPKMPPRRGWGIFGLGFYKDVAPTALGNSHREIRKTREIERVN